MMLDLPESICKMLDMIYSSSDEKVLELAYKFLWNRIKDYGMRWEYFV
jgi:hypothetical protein